MINKSKIPTKPTVEGVVLSVEIFINLEALTDVLQKIATIGKKMKLDKKEKKEKLERKKKIIKDTDVMDK